MGVTVRMCACCLQKRPIKTQKRPIKTQKRPIGVVQLWVFLCVCVYVLSVGVDCVKTYYDKKRPK